MSYEREFKFDFNQTILLEYSFYDDGLFVDKWTLFYGNNEIVSDRETSEEIELMLAKWLEREYARNGWNYQRDTLAASLERRYEDR